jgi:hypothetical protein
VTVNTVSLGSTPNFECACHTNHHNGKKPTRDDLFAVVATREGCEPSDVKAVLWLILRLPRDVNIDVALAELASLSESERKLARRVLLEIGLGEGAVVQ